MGWNSQAVRHQGFSLLEVIVAMAIFFISIVAIGQLITLAGEHALEIEQQGEAAMLAQAKLNEVISGVVALSAQSDQSFDEAPEFTWSLTADQNSSISNLYTVTVTVSRQSSDGAKVQVSLSQFVLDPAQRGSSQDTVTIASSGGGGGMGGTGASGSQGKSNPAQQSQAPGAAAAASKSNTPTTSSGASRGATTPTTTTPRGTTSTPTPTPRGTTSTPTTTGPRTTTPSTSTPNATTGGKKGG
jgi:prepilin-type N-terminal cleavage/methylation domain-containing protein